MKRTLGTCYYPEHWPRDIWEDDARRMAKLGLTWVRIGEFAWSRLEPTPGDLRFEWLDEAIEVLGRHGLKVVLGTPTATPPRWMVDRHPDILAVDADGNPRKFGSRRHYCFSHEGYKQECARIVTLLAERYGKNPHVAAWQTDNEYGCHDTTISYSDAARVAFQDWLRNRFGDIDRLNQAWGNVFWSMEYNNFNQIDLPNLTVTEANPSHSLAFRRFSSDQVVDFNRLQVDIIRQHSTAPITHNYMGRITDFDHFKVGEDLDFASWDSYPLGFLEDRVGADTQHQRDYARQGDPDFQAFHHDLYRAVGKGRWWVMEQQPGPVNWAPYNPAPAAGMVRLWSWEAFAHGAEAVCYFRWRQAPMAQEQMHAGLLRPDSVETSTMEEVRQVVEELRETPDVENFQAPVAIIFDYDADAAWDVQPHGVGLSYFKVVFDLYSALRTLGLSIDILPATTRDFTGYKAVFAPGMMHMPEELKLALINATATAIIGPRSGARNSDMQIPTPLPPALAGSDLVVTHVESLRPDTPIDLEGGGLVEGYFEHLTKTGTVLLETADGKTAALDLESYVYVAGVLDRKGWVRIVQSVAKTEDIALTELPDGIRLRQAGKRQFWFNYTAQTYRADNLEIPAFSVVSINDA